MAGDRVTVRPEDLLAHARTVDAIAAEVETARQAGDAVRVGASAYGQLCGFVPALLDHFQGAIVDGMGVAAQSLHETAQRLRQSSETYQAADDTVTHHLTRIRGAL